MEDISELDSASNRRKPFDPPQVRRAVPSQSFVTSEHRSTSMLSNDVRAWPIWDHVDRWISPRDNWKSTRKPEATTTNSSPEKANYSRPSVTSNSTPQRRNVERAGPTAPQKKLPSIQPSSKNSSPIDAWENNPSNAPWTEWNAQWVNSDFQHSTEFSHLNPYGNNTNSRPASHSQVATFPGMQPSDYLQSGQNRPKRDVSLPDTGSHYLTDRGQRVYHVPGSNNFAQSHQSGFLQEMAVLPGEPARSNNAPRRNASPQANAAPAASGAPAALGAPALPRPARKRRGWAFRTFKVLVLLVCVGGIIGGGMFYSFVKTQQAALPVLPANPAALLSESSVILAADGSELGYVFGERRTWVDLENISPVAVQALLAAEDHRFFEHNGIDFKRMLGAAWNTFNGSPEGASTITMQLVRNYYPSVKNTSTAERKVREMFMARRINEAFSKDDVLELYLNTVAFGSNSFGIEAAAKRFFSTSASELNLAQASLLVGMLKGPSKYNPFTNEIAARDRRNVIIRRMNALGMLSITVANETLQLPLGLAPSIYKPSESIAPHFVDFVRKEAEKWAAQNGYDLKEDGLTIRTTLDPYLQSLALKAVERQMEDLQNIISREFGVEGSRTNNTFWRSRKAIEDDFLRKSTAYVTLTRSGRSDLEALSALRSDSEFVREVRASAAQLEAGFVAIDPHSGQVKAWVGGRDYSVDQFDKVGSAARQPGSIFKPFLYAAALDFGFSPYYLVEDRLKTFVTNSRGERWRPTNSGGGASGRLVTLRQGLAWSKNTVSAHLVDRLGPQRVIDVARKMGVTSPMLPVPSIALGTSETTLLEMVHSYATFADYGTYRNVSVISSIVNRNGETIATFPSEPKRALSTQTAYTMIDMLRGVVDGGTGGYLRTRFGVKGDLAGKTGTTQNNADGWFIAMHPDLVVGAWVGFNDQRIAFQSNYWGQGGHNALLLVGDFLRQSTARPGAYLKNNRFKAPSGYRYPKKPVYSRPTPVAEAEPDLPTVPVTRLLPRKSGPLPIRTPISNNK